MKNSFIYILFVFTFLTGTLTAQLTPEEAIAGMARGINLGNTLEPPTEGAWNNGPAQESYFDTYIEAGFTNVRVPVRWDMHTADSAPFDIDGTWMDRVEQVVDWGLSRGLFITLNGHHEDWLKNDYSNPTLQARYDAIWTQVAERFKDKSDKLLFEIINEPNGMTVAEVDDLNQRILGIIRVTNPTRNVIYGGNMYANSEQLLNAAIPTDDYLIGYYHAYDPWNFSGLGLGTWGTNSDYQQVTNKYTSVKNWSDANDIPIHHSEFGAVLDCDFNSRMRIYAHNVEQCIINGFAFSVWDDGGNFGVLNRANNTWPEIKDILMHYHEDSPNQIFSNTDVDPVTNETSIILEWNNRAIGGGNIIIEKSVGPITDFVQIADISNDFSLYADFDVIAGKTYTYRIYTTRADGTLLHGYPTRTFVSGAVQSAYSDAIPIPGIVEVEFYDNGGEGLAYHDDDVLNIPAGFRIDEGVDIGEGGDNFVLGYVANGEWIEYTVNVATEGIYTVDASIASEIANGTCSLDFEKNGASTTFAVPSTNSWNDFETITSEQDIVLEAGEQIMRLNITNNNAFNVDHFTFNFTSSNTTEQTAEQAGFKVSPNPTKGLLSIELSNSLLESTTELEVYRITGEKMGSFNTTGSSTNLDLSHFGNGVYMVHLIGKDIGLVHRVVVAGN